MTIVIVIYNKEKLGSGVCVVVDMMILFFSYWKNQNRKNNHISVVIRKIKNMVSRTLVNISKHLIFNQLSE